MIDFDALAASAEATPVPEEGISKPATEQQSEIYNAYIRNDSHLTVRAGAGCGKTSTEIEAAKRDGEPTIHISFNKDNAVETDKKSPYNLKARTMHSVGAAACRAKVNKTKVWSIMKTEYSQTFLNQYGAGIKAAVGTIKNNALGIHSPLDAEQILQVIAESDELPYLDEVQTETVLEAIAKVFYRSLADKDSIDFDDMLYFPVKYRLDLRLHSYARALLDEIQDFNPIQHEFIKLILEQNPMNILAVGDPHQAIYAFRGALDHSYYQLSSLLSAKELFLSKTFRCAKSIVAEANRLVPELSAFDTNPDGKVHHDYTLSDLRTLTQADMLLCRNNAPLFPYAMRLLRQHVPFNMTATAVPRALKSIVSKIDARTLPALRDGLKLWYQDQHGKLTREGRVNRAMYITDQYEGIMSIIPSCDSPRDVVNFFSRLTTPGHGVQLSTVHKAKGLEADRVFILAPSLLRRGTEGQGKNVQYVAITRARNELMFMYEEEK